jgi:hypothetical protein
MNGCGVIKCSTGQRDAEGETAYAPLPASRSMVAGVHGMTRKPASLDHSRMEECHPQGTSSPASARLMKPLTGPSCSSPPRPNAPRGGPKAHSAIIERDADLGPDPAVPSQAAPPRHRNRGLRDWLRTNAREHVHYDRVAIFEFTDARVSS